MTEDWNPYLWDQEHEDDPPEHRSVPRNPATLRVEIGRLRRARKLWCVRVGPRQYVVQGSNEPHWIDMHGDEPCYCEDALISRQGAPEDERRPGYVCKHVLRALIYEKHPLVMAYIQQEEGFDEQRNRWATDPHG